MADRYYTTHSSEIERLLAMGFDEAEADRLIYMKDHVAEHGEYQEMLAESRRLNFIRWLIEHDRLSN